MWSKWQSFEILKDFLWLNFMVHVYLKYLLFLIFSNDILGNLVVLRTIRKVGQNIKQSSEVIRELMKYWKIQKKIKQGFLNLNL